MKIKELLGSLPESSMDCLHKIADAKLSSMEAFVANIIVALEEYEKKEGVRLDLNKWLEVCKN